VRRISSLLFFLMVAIPAIAQQTEKITPPIPKPLLCQSGLQRDWKKAIWRAPLHIALSAPVAGVSLVIPPLGKKYVQARVQAEAHDLKDESDTCMKATIDLYTQTALVRAVLRMYGITIP
jgi:hypothetical protein